MAADRLLLLTLFLVTSLLPHDVTSDHPAGNTDHQDEIQTDEHLHALLDYPMGDFHGGGGSLYHFNYPDLFNSLTGHKGQSSKVSCPDKCVCSQNEESQYEEIKVECNSQNLTSVPAGISPNTVIL